MKESSAKLRIGDFYARWQISRLFGGDAVTYLPHIGETITCGCFDPKLNPYAPEIVPYGSGKKVVRYAKLLAQQKGIIPVFLKRAPNRWEYRGEYQAIKNSSSPELLHPSFCGRQDAIGVLLFKRVDSGIQSEKSQLNVLPDIDLGAMKAQEGQVKLVTHLRRERNPKLVQAKKQFVLKQTGRLACEVCDFDFFSIPEIGQACCEVHHLQPLSVRPGGEITSLKDLAIVCSNCHRMIHRTNPLLTAQQLRRRMKKPNDSFNRSAS